MTVKSSSLKRLSLIGRQSLKPSHNEKKRQSGGSEALQSQQPGEQNADDAEEEEAHGPEPRQLYFNQPLPPSMVDEDGAPLQQFTRNKIRTAKYTPLSFLPKNLWFQFQNIANIFFLFVVILVVSIHARTTLPCPWVFRYRAGPLTLSRSSLYSEVLILGSMPYH